ncbi:MAG: sigma-70 family RNA polymerase sigma factor [bacterium]|nr:sigma-70 family RNA polymerase sigma factor [bacterium]
MDKPSEVTQLLLAWSDGDETALERLMPLVEAELRRLARAYMARERPDHTLQATALVNELCLRLLGRDTVSWRNRAHFMGFAAETMKRILVDHARKRQTRKRGEGVKPLPLDEVTELAERRDRELIALDDALLSLSMIHERQSRVVVLRSFANLTNEEIGEVLGVSAETVKRDWRAARAWLRREIRASEPELLQVAEDRARRPRS